MARFLLNDAFGGPVIPAFPKGLLPGFPGILRTGEAHLGESPQGGLESFSFPGHSPGKRFLFPIPGCLGEEQGGSMTT